MVLTQKTNMGIQANAIKRKTEAFLKELGKSIKEEIDEIANKNHSTWGNLWDFQLQDLFRTMWVSIPVTGGDLKNNYQEKHSRIQRFMEERKSTRTFTCWQGNAAPKCSQCGHREAIGPEDFTENGKFWNLLRRKGRTKWMLNRSEKLCAVCLVKRMVMESELSVPKISFHSTSDIAAISFRKTLKDKKEDVVVKQFIEKVRALDQTLGGDGIKDIDEIPGDWLYKEGLDANKIIREFQLDEDDEKLVRIREGAKEAGKKLEEIYTYLGFEPSKYYAILMLDADKMGEYLSGMKMPAGETFSLDWQVNESSKIIKLGVKNWPDIIKKWDGLTIYSGGDDLLAFGPLMGALTTAHNLKNIFCKEIGTTISASIIIGHHNDSLRRALEDARSALEMAKNVYERNAIVITLKLSSGASYTCGYKWDIDAGVSFTEDFIWDFVRWISMKKEGLSPGFIYDLLKETEAFYNTDHKGNFHLKTPYMLISECQRLFKRHIPKKSPIWITEKGKDQTLVQSLVKIANPEREDKTRHSFNTKENLNSLLKIIAFLARKE